MYNLAYGDNAEDNMNMYSIFFFWKSHENSCDSDHFSAVKKQ